MDEEAFNRLLSRVKEDEGLFHALVFDTGKAVDAIDVLSDADKERLKLVDSRNVLRGILAGAKADCGVTVQCTQTCGHTSSAKFEDLAAKLSDCGVTVSCGSTCTHTVSGIDRPGQIDQIIRAGLG